MLIDRAEVSKHVIFIILNTINNHEISVQYIMHNKQCITTYLFIYYCVELCTKYAAHRYTENHTNI